MDKTNNTFIDPESGMNVDLVERSAAYLMVVKEVDEEASKVVESFGQKEQMGSCHILWSSKKEILNKKHNIDWRTPAELNEHIMFD